MAEQVEVRSRLTNAAMAASFGEGIEFDKPMAALTSYGTGGPARYYLEVDSSEKLSGAVATAVELRIPYFVIGGGSNLLVSDSGYDGLIVKIAVKGIVVKDETVVECGAGEDLRSLIDFATSNGLTGLEFAAGIWGTVGGAIYGNAGAYGGEIKDVIKSLTLVDASGGVRSVSTDYCRFSYRDSQLKRTREIVVDATFQLKQGDKLIIKNKVDEIMASRESKHPTCGKSAGCFFKNIPDPAHKHGKLAAGQLLDEAGAKGLKVGGAAVYEKHANIIVNIDNATSKDIRQLADTMKKKVFDKFGVALEEEVIQLGEF